MAQRGWQRCRRLWFVWNVKIPRSANQAWCFYFCEAHLGCNFTWEFPFQKCSVTIMGLDRLHERNVPGKHHKKSEAGCRAFYWNTQHTWICAKIKQWSCFPGVQLPKYLLCDLYEWGINTELHQSAHHEITYHTIIWNVRDLNFKSACFYTGLY